VIDTVLHKERIGSRNLCNSIDDLPDGTFVTNDGVNAYLVWKKNLFLWTPGGYLKAKRTDVGFFPAKVLTPPSIVRSFAAGYPMTVHPSAFAP